MNQILIIGQAIIGIVMSIVGILIIVFRHSMAKTSDNFDSGVRNNSPDALWKYLFIPKAKPSLLSQQHNVIGFGIIVIFAGLLVTVTAFDNSEIANTITGWIIGMLFIFMFCFFYYSLISSLKLKDTDDNIKK